MLNSRSISADILSRRATRPAAGADGSSAAATAFLVLDTESVPDGRLLSRLKYPDDNLSPEAAVERAQTEAREQSANGSDFLPVTFHVPVAACVLRVAADFTLQAVTCLDAPRFRPEEIVRQFWKGVAHYRARLVTFNGRGFDLPLLELAAFDLGCSARDYFYNSRNRFNGNHLDLLDWLSNYGAYRLTGGLDMLAKRLHPRSRSISVLGMPAPGKLEVAGDQVYQMHREGRLREINDYCMFDTLDTYFLFLRTRLLLGEMTPEQERDLVRRARTFLDEKVQELPALQTYLANWELSDA